MLLDTDNEAFVGRRIQDGGMLWQIPQCGIALGDLPRDAALPARREEIGTDNVASLTESRGWIRRDLSDYVKGRIWGGRWQGQQRKWFSRRFLGSEAKINLQTDHPEFSGWPWADTSPGSVKLVVPKEFRGSRTKREPGQKATR